MCSQLTLHAKKAAEEAGNKVQEASKSALEASKTAAGMSRNTLGDLTYVGKSTFGDLTKSAKEAATKKGLLKVSLALQSLIKNITVRQDFKRITFKTFIILSNVIIKYNYPKIFRMLQQTFLHDDLKLYLGYL